MAMRTASAVAGFLAGALVIALVAGWLLFDRDAPGAESGPSIDEIVGAPAAWAGRRVEVSGRIVSVRPGALTIGARDAELLVIVPDRERLIGPQDVGAPLRVRGVVERFDGQLELAPGEASEPRRGDALLRAGAVQRPVATG